MATTSPATIKGMAGTKKSMKRPRITRDNDMIAILI